MRAFWLGVILLGVVAAASAETRTFELKAGWNAGVFPFQKLTELQSTADLAGCLSWDGAQYQSLAPTPAALNAGAGTRRGFWLYARQDGTLTVTGGDDGRGNFIDLQPGWNLAGFPSRSPIACRSLTALENDRPVPLDGLLSPGVYQIGSAGYELLDLNAADAQLDPETAYWIFSHRFCRLTWTPGGSASQVLLIGLSQTVGDAANLAAYDPRTRQPVAGSPFKFRADGHLTFDPVNLRVYLPSFARGLEVAGFPGFQTAPFTPIVDGDADMACAYDTSHDRIYLAIRGGIRVFRARDYSVEGMLDVPAELPSSVHSLVYDPNHDRLYALVKDSARLRVAIFDCATLSPAPGSPRLLSTTDRPGQTEPRMALDLPLNRLLIPGDRGLHVVDVANNFENLPGSPVNVSGRQISIDGAHNQVFVTSGTALEVLDRGSLQRRRTLLGACRNVVFSAGADTVFTTSDQGVTARSATSLEQLPGSPFTVPGTGVRYRDLCLAGDAQSEPSPAPLPSPSPGAAGVTWTLRTTTQEALAVTFGGERFLAAKAGEALLSPTGLTWTSRSAPWARTPVMAYGNGRFLAISQTENGLRREAWTSPDGEVWTPQSDPVLTDSAGFGLTVVNAPSILFAGVGQGTGPGFSGAVVTSPDGQSWTRRSSADYYGLGSLAYGNGQFVAVGGGKVRTSADGLTWTARSANLDPLESIGPVVFGNGKFVALGHAAMSKFTLTSSDGATWTRHGGLPTTASLGSMTFGDGSFVLYGNAVVTSPDGVNWTVRPCPLTSLAAMAYGAGRFVGVNFGGIVTSP